jgi:NADH dehydrogenase [ubiquinone] 1 alpha subcomplex assembly factor 1
VHNKSKTKHNINQLKVFHMPFRTLLLALLISASFCQTSAFSLKMSASTQQLDNARSLISNAISIGAPAYNKGDVSECARVYRDTALKIVSSNMIPQNLQTGLEAAIATDHEDANEAAWAFRRQFDAIIEYQIPFMPENKFDSSKFTLDKFNDNMIPSVPLVVNDNVMGGVSQGQWIPDSGTFRGNTSLANNGGFASLRWRMKTVQNWSYAKGIYLRIKHSHPDVHTFRIILKDTTCEQVRGANFKNVFSNPSQTDEPIFIPFEAFDQIEQMGRALSGPVFNRGAVTELGFMAIKPSVVGNFELQVVEWGLYF